MYDDIWFDFRSVLEEGDSHFSLFEQQRLAVFCKPLLFENGLSSNLEVLF
jgi:hypothetical protein